MKKIILDTGPLIAFLDINDKHHLWAKENFDVLKPPFFSCEAVLAEACFLLNKIKASSQSIFELLHRNLIISSFSLQDEITSIKKLMLRYQNVPISLADACLVRMSEQYANSSVLTLDHDFQIYRRHGREVITTWMP